MVKEKKRKLISITRKIELNINCDDKDQRKEYYQTLYEWQKMVRFSANFIMTHMFLQDQIKEFIYLEEEVKVKLAKKMKLHADGTEEELNADGILTTSRMNTTYQVLSKKFKGQIPTSILTCLNNQLTSIYNAEQKEYYIGERSLRNYKRNIPIPFDAGSMLNMRKADQYNNYAFTLYGIPFKTYFGIDASKNRTLFDKAIKGEYKLCNSSIQITGKKMFLLAAFSFDKQETVLDPENTAEAFLHFDHPMVVKINGKDITIGTKEKYLHRRISIQAQHRKAQRASKWTRAGDGRTRRLQQTEVFHKWETNYIQTRMHKYSNELIRQCIQYQVGKLVLKDQQQSEEEAREQPFVLRNWSYYSLVDKIKYKASRVGIELVIE